MQDHTGPRRLASRAENSSWIASVPTATSAAVCFQVQAGRFASCLGGRGLGRGTAAGAADPGALAFPSPMPRAH